MPLKLAHLKKNNGDQPIEQSLSDHLLAVGNDCKNMAALIGLSTLAFLIGVFHDLGKAAALFQEYLRGAKITVNHSSAGAHFLFIKGHDFLLKKYGQINPELTAFLCFLTYPILQHHGLFDVVNFSLPKDIEGQKVYLYPYYRILQRNSEEDLKEALEYGENLSQKFDLSLNTLLEKAFNEWKIFDEKLQKMAESSFNKAEAYAYYQGCGIRLLLSILKEADIYNSANYFREMPDRRYSKKEIQDIWNECQDHMEKASSDFEKKANASELGRIRCRLSSECKKASKLHESGLFTLELPTGAGKTASVLRFAVNHAQNFQDQRIFYTTAFLSVLEQSADSVKKFLGDQDYILEHHSNVVRDDADVNPDRPIDDIENQEDKDEISSYQYLIESWESPIILTTLVQLTNTLFGGKSSQLRRFCKLMHSVIIMDEVQSLPLKVIYNMNLMTNFLTVIMGATVVHCTATTPIYDHPIMAHPALYKKISENSQSLAKVEDSELSCFERVEFYSLLGNNSSEKISTTDFVACLYNKMQEALSALIICNKKSEVMDLYQSLLEKSGDAADPKIKFIYLSTNLCPAHRLQLIHQMDELLKANRRGEEHRLICVSTQLVEAGVDLDFDLVFREASGLDSLIQSAGRCNREGKRTYKKKRIPGKCFAFRLQQDELKNLPDIQKAQDAFLASMRKFAEEESKLFDPQKLKEDYFTRYYQQNETSMMYLLHKSSGKRSILNLLSTNEESLNDFYTKIPQKGIEFHNFDTQTKFFSLHQNFKFASENFRLIEEKNQITVLVPYQNQALLEQLFKTEETQNFTLAQKLLQKASIYTVALPQSFMEQHPEAFYSLFDRRIFILDDEWYDPDLGLKINDGENNMSILIE